ncbi:MAG: hypothetical protein ACFCUQ_21560 [Kiloniellales bacterium]
MASEPETVGFAGLRHKCHSIAKNIVEKDYPRTIAAHRNRSGHYRFTFGSNFFGARLHIVLLIVGLFALSEMKSQMKRVGSDTSVAPVELK